MSPRLPLSVDMTSGPFLLSDALQRGWTEGRMRGKDLVRPFAGVRTLERATLEADYAPRLRDGERFSHLSAARLWGAPLPPGFGDVHVSRPGSSRARASGVVGHRSSIGLSMIRHGLPASAPMTLFLESASLLTLPDLVAVGDHLVHEPRELDPRDIRPYVSLDELRTGCREATGPGVRRARAASLLVRMGAESRAETQLRLLASEAGLPEPELQYELLGDSGRWIGFFDLAWPQARLLSEYDGDQHRTSSRQYDRDIRRFDGAADIGWRVIRVRAHGIGDGRDETLRRLQDAYAAGIR